MIFVYIAAPSRVVGSAMLNQVAKCGTQPIRNRNRSRPSDRAHRHRSEPATAGRLNRLGLMAWCVSRFSECQSGRYRIWNTSKATRENSNIDAPVDVAMTVA